MRSIHEHLTTIAAMVSRFLKEQGGMENGYETFVQGTVRRRTHSALIVSTPRLEENTMIQNRILGRKLNDEIEEYIREHNIECVTFRSVHVEHGCHRTLVDFVTTVEVRIR